MLNAKIPACKYYKYRDAYSAPIFDGAFSKRVEYRFHSHSFENIGIIRTGSIPRTWTYSFCATAGLAKDSSDSSDFGSILTITGKREVTDIAKSLKELGVQFNFVITSPLKRAHQTASSWP
jgi:Histidine phosphatase superfamily (branch 1)